MSIFTDSKRKSSAVAASPSPLAGGSKAVKRRQSMMFGIIMLTVGTALVAAVAMLNSRKPPVRPSLSNEVPVSMASPISAPGSAIDAHDAWRGKEAARIAELEQKLASLSETVKNPQASGARSGATGQGAIPGFPPNMPAGLVVPPAIPVPPAPVAASMPPMPPRGMPNMPRGGIGSNNPPLDPSGGMPNASNPPVPYQDDGIEVGTMDDGTAGAIATTPHAAGDTRADVESKPAKTVANYVPSGTFVRAVLLGGLDAPTGGQAQSNPQPVLLRLVDDSQLPNRFRSRMKECHIVATGYGDLSAERAYIRTESLSCITLAGDAIDIQVKGYVAGEDGKAGMRGRLVTKQGQVLANALISGIGAGLGQAFQQNATITSTSALGTTTSVQPGKQLQSGLTAGVGKAFDRLAQYYITLAEKLFPVIEVDAGRTVDVVFTRGADFPMGDSVGERANEVQLRYGMR